jgi:DNA polymerase
MVCADGRIHGFAILRRGAYRRWAGRLVQVQNLPQNHLRDLDYARQLVKAAIWRISS